MQYLAALDYDHLDNGIFLTAVGRALARQDNVRAILVHGDSEYTERLIQTGRMREDARIRCIKDLNHRLVALFADQGVATIGLNGYQRNLVMLENNQLEFDKAYFDSLPKEPVLLLSNLVFDKEREQPVPIALDRYFDFIRKQIAMDELFLFAKSDGEDTLIKDQDSPLTRKQLPDEFSEISFPVRLTTANTFEKLPDLTGSEMIS